MLKWTEPCMRVTLRVKLRRWVVAFLQKVPACISASRQARADLYINAYLRSCDDERLEMMGFTREEVRKVRNGKDLADIRCNDAPSCFVSSEQPTVKQGLNELGFGDDNEFG